MIVRKTLSLKSIYEFTGHHFLWLTCWMSFVTLLFYFTDSKLMALPWLPLPLIGTAVAFYVGFKNNQSYDRLWEARKIWSDIINGSRMLATTIKNYRSGETNETDGADIRRQIILRHIAYLYQLRQQLLEPAQWEHVSQERSWLVGHYNRRRRAELSARFKDELDTISSTNYLSREEIIQLQRYNNKAVQLLNIQTGMIQELYNSKTINMIQQIEIQAAINVFYNSQGKLERIKQTPFPRKYATFSFLFVCIFIFFLPFGIVGEFSNLGGAGIWLAIPVGSIIGWIFVTMELIGDYSENPFEGLHNDTPMLSICRDIEIDMLQAMGEKNIPDPVKPKENVLL